MNLELAGRQHGLLTYRQLADAAYSRGKIRSAIARGALVPLYRHVYVVAGAPRTWQQTVLAAVFAAGKTAFASHETAAQLWRLPLPRSALLEVTVVLERSAELPGVTVHRSGRLEEHDVRDVDSIPVSSPERTIVDLSSRLSSRQLGRVVDEALRRRVTSLARIEQTVTGLRRAPGRSPSKVRVVLDRRIQGAEANDSLLEDFALDALRRFELPLPQPQVRVYVGGSVRYLDLAYAEPRVFLDVLGFEYHGQRGRFDDDAVRRNELRQAGWDVREITSALTDVRIAQEVASALGRADPTASARAVSYEEWRRLR